MPDRSPADLGRIRVETAAAESERLALDARTIDQVATLARTGKLHIVFRAHSGSVAGGLYGLRLLC
jgi:uncharacterized protein involved in propanediol utilization